MSQKSKRKAAMMTAEVVPGSSTQVAKEVAKSELLGSPEKKQKMTEKGDSSSSNEQTEEEIHKFMDETFVTRRAFVTEEMPAVIILREHFPYLFKGRQMLAEFQRITGMDIDHLIQEYCVKYASTVIDIGRQTPGSGGILKQAETAKQQNLALKQYWDMVTALCLLPLLLKENLVEMVREVGNEDEIDPKGKIVPILISKGSIFKSDEFILVVEEEVVQEFEEFTIALGTLFSAYWVFNMQYPRTLNNTYNFIQKAILHLRDGTPFPPLCRQLVQRIQKMCTQGKRGSSAS
ncbi:uncharacterized protein LOC133187565 [Saccostrea echinata]|uniref:uncharacterized protein LOC133187565 n=1 Tax=Saccostrea echinata TaxID=191078 RepID=UPI002A811465|nr:uncharacterized protein LOC133187565 [Saccostrea echinata]